MSGLPPSNPVNPEDDALTSAEALDLVSELSGHLDCYGNVYTQASILLHSDGNVGEQKRLSRILGGLVAGGSTSGDEITTAQASEIAGAFGDQEYTDDDGSNYTTSSVEQTQKGNDTKKKRRRRLIRLLGLIIALG